MALSFVLDEHLRGPLWRGICQHNAADVDVLDVLRVGDVASSPLGTSDQDLLLWCEAHGRVLVTSDWTSMPGHFTRPLQAGHHIPGVLYLKPGWRIPSVIATLLLLHQALDPAALLDQSDYIS